MMYAVAMAASFYEHKLVFVPEDRNYMIHLTRKSNDLFVSLALVDQKEPRSSVTAVFPRAALSSLVALLTNPAVGTGVVLPGARVSWNAPNILAIHVIEDYRSRYLTLTGHDSRGFARALETLDKKAAS